MISTKVKLIAVDKKDAGSANAGTRNTVTRNDNTEAYIPNDIELDTLKIGSAYLCYDKNANALKVYGANNGSMNLYALGGVSALGQSSVQGGGSSGSGGISYNRLDSWEDYDANKAGWVLSAGLGNDLNSRVASLENGQIEGGVTQEWVQNQGYLTELPVATTNALGAIKIGYSANGKNYPVMLDNSRAYVSVPWSDTTYGVFDASVNGLVPMASASNKTTAETSVGNYYLCADGKFRQLPTNAFNNTWRPLGTGANNACAGNDARLSDARPASDVSAWAKAATKPSYTLDEVTDGSTRKLSNYLPLSGGRMSNTNVVTNLNADLLDGQHASEFATQTWVNANFNKYVLPIATSAALGGIKSGGDITVNSSTGVVKVDKVTTDTGILRGMHDAFNSALLTPADDRAGVALCTLTDKIGTYLGYYQGESFFENLDGGTENAEFGAYADGRCTMNNMKAGKSMGLNANGTGYVNANFEVTGSVHATAGISSDTYVTALATSTTSDKRLKDIKENLDLPIETFAEAPAVKFEWKNNKELGMQVGTIAQYWEEKLKEVVHDRGDGYLSMQYDVAALLGTITIAKKVVEQEDMIKKLEEAIEKLRNEIDMMKKG